MLLEPTVDVLQRVLGSWLGGLPACAPSAAQHVIAWYANQLAILPTFVAALAESDRPEGARGVARGRQVPTGQS